MVRVVFKKLKVSNSIIVNNMINMMNNFFWLKITAKFLFHYKAVFINVTSDIREWMVSVFCKNISKCCFCFSLPIIMVFAGSRFAYFSSSFFRMFKQTLFAFIPSFLPLLEGARIRVNRTFNTFVPSNLNSFFPLIPWNWHNTFLSFVPRDMPFHFFYYFFGSNVNTTRHNSLHKKTAAFRWLIKERLDSFSLLTAVNGLLKVGRIPLLAVFILSFYPHISSARIDLLSEQDQVALFENFKGINTLVSDQNLPPEFATRSENLRFTPIGSLKKRFSYSKYNGTSLGTDPIYFGTRFYFTDESSIASKKLVVAYSTTLKSGTDSSGTFTNIATGLTANLYFTSVIYKDHLYMCNGTDNCQRWSGSGNTKTMGLAVPGSGTTAADGGAGNLANGAYKYKIIFLYDAYQESNGQATETSITVSGGPKNVDLSSIPTGATDQGVTARRVYRTKAGGSTYFRVATISDNTTTTYTDSATDGSLDTTLTIPTDHFSPPAFKYIVVHKERIFGVKKNSSDLYFSKIENGVSLPDAFDTTDDVISIAPDDGDIIQAIEEGPDGIFTIFKRNSVRKLFVGTAPPEEWEVSAIFDPHGVVSPYSVARSPQGIIYFSRTGLDKRSIRVFNGQNSQDISERIQPTLENISRTLIENIVGNYHDEKYRMAYADRTTGATENNRVLIYDFERDAYSIDLKDVNAFIPWDGAGDQGQLYSGDSGDGLIYLEDTETSDLFVELLSQISGGTFTQTESGGTEAAPTITLIQNQITDDVGNKTWAELTGTDNEWQDHNSEISTWWPSGQWVSPVYEINAINMVSLYWTETLTSNSDLRFWIRTGDSTSVTQSAAWNGPYTTPTGSGISAVSAGQYIQLKAQLYTKDTSIVTTPKLSRSGSADPDDYVIWVSAGLGTPAETSINFVWQTGDYDYGNDTVRKRWRQVEFFHESAVPTNGAYTIYYSADGGTESSFTVDLDDDPTNTVKYFPITVIGRRLKMRIEETSDDAFELKNGQVIFSTLPRHT